MKPKNIDNKPIKIYHKNLERYDEESIFKSICPICENGLLLLARGKETFKLLSHDRCTLCGQIFIYEDINELRESDWAK